jgi:hypothetical protein
MKHTNIQLNHHDFFIQLLHFTNIIFIFITIIIHTNSIENPITNKNWNSKQKTKIQLTTPSLFIQNIIQKPITNKSKNKIKNWTHNSSRWVSGDGKFLVTVIVLVQQIYTKTIQISLINLDYKNQKP